MLNQTNSIKQRLAAHLSTHEFFRNFLLSTIPYSDITGFCQHSDGDVIIGFVDDSIAAFYRSEFQDIVFSGVIFPDVVCFVYSKFLNQL